MNVRDAYNSWSSTYDTDRNLTRDLDQRVTREILGGLQPAYILELGCGTGKNTAFLAQIGEHVQALDFSEGMLQQARAKVPNANVVFNVADLTQSWPCADQATDLIVCNLVLEHIADLTHIFAEAKRCLTPGGRFFVCELHPFKQYLGSKARFHQGDTEVPIAVFTHNIADFLDAADTAGLKLEKLGEWRHDEDQQAPPRLISFMFHN